MSSALLSAATLGLIAVARATVFMRSSSDRSGSEIAFQSGAMSSWEPIDPTCAYSIGRQLGKTELMVALGEGEGGRIAVARTEGPLVVSG